MSEPNALQRFIGAALIGVGVMMMLLCGGCGALFLVSFVFGSLFASNSGGLSMLILPILLGGLPTLVGFGLFTFGRRLQMPR